MDRRASASDQARQTDYYGVDCSDQPPEILWTLAKHPQQWLRRVKGTERHYYRAIGSAEALMAKAKALGQRWMKGISAAKAIR